MWKFSRITVLIAIALSACAIAVAAPKKPASGDTEEPPAKLKHIDPNDLPLHETKYYHVYSDLDPQDVQEASIRMTKMAEEYHARTADFAGEIRAKLPFYLFKSVDEYYAGGGMPHTGGFFDGVRLMAIGDKRLGGEVWHIVQHEGFHQFVHAVIGGDIPIWVNEGMAEYFGEAIFTGDGFVTGVISPKRLARVLKTMDLKYGQGGFHPLRKMMDLSHATWNDEINQQNYDQAWSMVQFLAHGDDGKYQKAFGHYMGLVGGGGDAQESWDSTFGADTEAFDQRWRAYWKSLSADPTSELYLKATIATLDSYLGRAFNQKQTFDSFDAFEHAARDGKLRASTDEWLPPTLLESALKRLATQEAAGNKFSITFSGGNHIPQINCESAEGQKFVGKFVLRSNHVAEVNVTITGTKHAAPATAPAEKLKKSN